jgi:AcrR family transcriptional regulator
MARRGEKLREHILYAAKNVFLEMGFERASMEVIAGRAETSKRTLYAHFESKEKLYLAIIELVREMSLSKLKTPGHYSDDPAEALVMFCGRYLEGLLFTWTVRMCRMSIAEADRFPEGSARYFDVIFSAPHERLSAYLTETFGLSAKASADAAQELLGRLIHPRFPRALFGLETLSEHLHDEAVRPDFDLAPVRKAVGELMESLGGLPANPKVVSANSRPGAGTEACRHEITDAHWECILPLLPPQRPRTGRPALDHRRVVNGILWVLGTGAPWRDLPARYGSWRTVYSRWRRWRDAGVWQAVLAESGSDFADRF